MQADTIRANLKPYDPKILSDANRGLWELWENQGTGEGDLVPLTNPLIARNPKADIKEGVVGIDFGTTSSVVVCQEESAHIYPLRIGLGDLTQEIEKIQYENPTIIAFNDLSTFLQAYNAQKGRPKTKWESVKIAHEAKNDMHNSPSHHYNSFFSALKAWAGDKSRKMQILDRQGAHFELKGSLDLSEGDLNPIEIYAYYLGLYINNQYNGIFLNYLLSFPVTYELEVREMILESFKKGIAKSMPNALHAQGVVEQLKVEKGASEPAAYAISALEGYGFEPSDEEQVYYGVFDFGGGTTDFDFGLFTQAPEHSRYDYVLEHFGAGGDRYLGGENLLELASFEVVKYNRDVLLQQHISFKKPAEGMPFAGSETLLNESQEARCNTQILAELLRPLWEGRDFEGKGDDRFSFSCWGHDGEPNTIHLDYDSQQIFELFKERIKRGVDNFFSEFFRATARFFEKKGMLEEGQGINTFHIFLAGNSSKSPLVKELFEAKIAQISEQDANQAQTPIDYKLYAPLESADFTKPNGKTGVAFGLVQARKGGAILVIDSNVEENIRFKYYLERSKKRKFYTLIDRDHPYNKWKKFLDASESQFEVYYTTQASAANNHLGLTDHAIKKKSLETGVNNPHAFIFIRLVSPSAFEFVVATDEGLADENYLSSVQKVEL
ncbi:acetate and sugar kinases/Hsc70/actin family protein [Helicobacter felis]|uniref:molecular chaperone DnaK n=1 Tax=Helicobacter felis TaxID=214 RepID=UPI000CF0F0D4|nr:molecular chaperone DnaK [Helicobacter felis]